MSLKIIYLVLMRFQPVAFFRELLMSFPVWYSIYIEVMKTRKN